MILYQHQPDEIFSTPGLDEDDGWWVGIQKAGATLAIAAALSLTGSLNTQARSVFAYDPAEMPPQAPAPVAGNYQQTILQPSWETQNVGYSFGLEEIPAGSLSTIEEYYWQNPVPPVPGSIKQPLPYWFDAVEITQPLDPIFNNAANNQASATDNISVTISVPAGHTIVVCCSQNVNNTSTLTLTDSSGGANTYVQTTSGYSSRGATNRMAMFVSVLAQPITSITGTWSGGISATVDLVVFDISNTSPSGVEDSSVNSNGVAATTATSGSLNTTNQYDILVFGTQLGSATSAPAAANDFILPVGGANSHMIMTYKVVQSLQLAEVTTQTWTTSSTWTTIFGAFKGPVVFAPDEDYWQNQVRPVPTILGWPQQWTFDPAEMPPQAPAPVAGNYQQTILQPSWETQNVSYLFGLEELPAGSLHGPEEDYWQLGPRSVPGTLLWPQQWNFEQQEIVPQPTIVDEDYWQNPVFPVPGTNYVAKPSLDPEEIPAGNLKGQPEEDYWQNAVAPVPARIQWTQQFGFDMQESIAVFGPDEDYELRLLLNLPPAAKLLYTLFTDTGDYFVFTPNVGVQNYVAMWGTHNFVNQEIGGGIKD